MSRAVYGVGNAATKDPFGVRSVNLGKPSETPVQFLNGLGEHATIFRREDGAVIVREQLLDPRTGKPGDSY